MKRRPLVCLALLWPAASFAVTPWMLQPALGVSTDYKTNPAYDPADTRDGSTTALSLSLPLATETGNDRLQLLASGELRASRGASAGDTYAYDGTGSWTRTAEHGSIAARVGTARQSLVGSTRPDLGLLRTGGYSITDSARLDGTRQIDEFSALSAGVSATRQRFDASADPSLFDGRFASLQAAFTRRLGPRLTASLSASGGASQSTQASRRSRNAGAQLGFAFDVNEYWSLNLNGGSSVVRNQRTGDTSSGVTYDASVSAVVPFGGTLQLAASRGLQASGFGTLVEQQRVQVSYGRALSERMALAVNMSWDSVSDTLVGFDLDRREFREGGASLTYALSEDWSLALHGAWGESRLPATFLRRGASASSITGVLSLSRRFTPLRVF